MISTSTHVHLHSDPQIKVAPCQNSFCAMSIGGPIERADVHLYFHDEASVQAVIDALKAHVASRRKLKAVA